MIISTFLRGRTRLQFFTSVTALILLMGSCYSVYSQCASVAGPSSPQAASTQTYSGSAFGFHSTGNVFAEDGSTSFTFALLSLFGGTTDYLVMTGFTDSIPYYATICGVKVEMKKYATGINIFASVNDNAVYLVKGGALVGTPKALSADWTGTDTWYTYGGNGDTWGATLNVSDVTPASFGVAVSARLSGISVAPTARVDNVKITVYYDATTLPVRISSFSAVRSGDEKVQLQWNGGSGHDGSQFLVQRSDDNVHWQAIDSVAIAASDENYNVIDRQAPAGNSFYRLAMTQNGHNTFYSEVQSVAELAKSVIKIYPNPATDFITITAPATTGNLRISDMSGRLCLAIKQSMWQNAQRVSIKELPAGVYAIEIEGSVQRFVRR